MAMFVHLASEANAVRIRRAGVRAASRRADGTRGLFCFPVLPSYTLTHGWLRELSRSQGRRNLVAVQLRLPDGEPVAVGRYGRPPEAVTAAEAVRRIAGLPDPRGWEVFVPRAVTPAEVHRIRPVRQSVGWRYWPDAHGVVPCTCAGCRVRGEYGSRRLRERRPHPHDGPPPPSRVLLARIEAAGDPGDPAVLREVLDWYGHYRRGPVDRLTRLAGHPDPAVREALVWAVARWSTPGVEVLLDRLAVDPVPQVREAVADLREWDLD
ncbi:HEAT repeat domain-containing protein [Kitasatospora sp. RB6PN24]|uniref:HEAT repeat domain-containing protein n=1 Tax=Kitasatospora humi TaxID=2893891 RepID=UPI001E33F423|nr:HEAT repeat domain-containing protein [Kitasatospora humi]MCC9312251.1 HEAT repeat domain-containing protein [Kitasatospora humi]